MSETHLTASSDCGVSVSSGTRPEDRRTIFEQLFSKHSPMLYRMALRKLGNSADAEDALQDALLSAFRHYDQFKGQAQLSTWLITIVLNMARMQLRRRSNRIFISLDSQDDDGLSKSEMLTDAGPDPEEIRQKAQLREVLERCVVKLSPKIRAAFRLRVLEGLSSREAAERLGISEGALKAQFFRARTQISPHIQKVLGSQPESKKPSPGAQVREFRQGVTAPPERSFYRRVA